MSTLRERIEALVCEMEECADSPADLSTEDWASRLRSALESETREVADLAEIERMITNLESFAWKDGHDDMRGAISPECRAARSALLQRVEALRDERDNLVRSRIDRAACCAQVEEERDAALAAQKRSLDEWASLLARAEAAESALAAMRAAPPDAMRAKVEALLRVVEGDPIRSAAAEDEYEHGFDAGWDDAVAAIRMATDETAPAPPAALPPSPPETPAEVQSDSPGGEGDVDRGRPRDRAVNDAGPATGAPTAGGSPSAPETPGRDDRPQAVRVCATCGPDAPVFVTYYCGTCGVDLDSGAWRQPAPASGPCEWPKERVAFPEAGPTKLPLSTDMQGVDCGMCEDGTRHLHATPDHCFVYLPAPSAPVAPPVEEWTRSVVKAARAWKAAEEDVGPLDGPYTPQGIRLRLAVDDLRRALSVESPGEADWSHRCPECGASVCSHVVLMARRAAPAAPESTRADLAKKLSRAESDLDRADDKFHEFTEAVKRLLTAWASGERPKCRTCTNSATCVGYGEEWENLDFACDDCCGHGNEDGWCVPLAAPLASAPSRGSGEAPRWSYTDAELERFRDECHATELYDAAMEARGFASRAPSAPSPTSTDPEEILP